MTEVETQESVMTDEQAADFAALQMQAADEAGPVAPGQGAQPEPVQKATLDKEISVVLQMVAQVIRPMFPTVAEIYSPETCEAIGGALMPVCDKHGWLQGGIGGKYGEEIMALAVVAPIAWATVEAAKRDIAARALKSAKPGDGGGQIAFEAAENVPDAVPGQKAVSFGAGQA